MAATEIGDLEGGLATPYERFKYIVGGLGQKALERLEPQEEMRATLAAISIAGDPTQSVEHRTIVNLLLIGL